MVIRNRGGWQTLGDYSPSQSQEISQLQAINTELLDFAKNIAGLDDRRLLDTGIIKQWRDDARELLSKSAAATRKL